MIDFLKTLLPVPRFRQGLLAPAILGLIIRGVTNPVKAERPSAITNLTGH
jgi:hypothetical protein